jgi:hypothetical protein
VGIPNGRFISEFWLSKNFIAEQISTFKRAAARAQCACLANEINGFGALKGRVKTAGIAGAKGGRCNRTIRLISGRVNWPEGLLRGKPGSRAPTVPKPL